ncbi:SusC/RagA family TonB-linked outer membrane protein [Olivibacter sitiensis]|uniref:SusC/RagA family TonB-linked outer membrane protein n=1 Tax=Olivibacter sitiensis TaxID=376470 RepID=UPI00041D6EF3|nr:TonB-dependent receptor [Olivibacter sitiensis]
MKQTLLSFVILCALLVKSANAQERTITGKVTSKSDRLPLAGVSVSVENTKTGTQTDANGQFSITVPLDAKKLIFHHMGYATLTVEVQSKNVVDVALDNDAQLLDEVVVTLPYQTVDARSVTGAISTVTASSLSKQTVPSVTRALQGATTGTQVLTSVGQPGENPTIRIRGINSINASASPLIVLDGVPYGGNIHSINQADVESMTVLKDAASAALYGSRAANGVIMITTKSGKSGTPKFEASVLQGYSSRTRKEYNFLGAAESMQLTWEALRNYAAANGVDNPGKYASDNIIGNLRYNPYSVARPFDDNGNLVQGATLLWDTDWEKALTRSMKDTRRTDAQFSASGGNDRTKYYLSLGYLKDRGYAIASDFERISGRVNLTNKLSNWLNVGTNLNISSTDQNYPTQSGSTYSNIIQFSRNVSSIYPLHMRGENGELLLDEYGAPMYDWGTSISGRTVNTSRPVFENENPAGTYALNEIRYSRLTTSANTYAEMSLVDGLKFKTTYGIDFYNFIGKEFYNPTYGLGASVNGRGVREKNNTVQWTWSNQLSYAKTFANTHHLNIFGVYEAFNYNYDTLLGQKTGFGLAGLSELAVGTNNEFLSSTNTDETLNSYLAKVGYHYDYKYFIDLSYRRDGSSRFESQVRWGDFYSVSGAYDIAREKFMKSVSAINQLKLRASYGELGNNFTLNSNGTHNYFPYLSSFGTGYNVLSNTGVLLESLPSYLLTWEKSNTLNFGLDFSILANRINGSIDWYNKTTDGLIFSRPLPNSGGITSIIENIGALRNRGFEFTINSINLKNKDFLWNTSLLFSTNRNVITKLHKGQGINTGDKRYEEGKSVYEFYLEQWAGVNPQTGQPQWYYDVTDENGNTTQEMTSGYSSASNSRKFSGSALPDFTAGLTNDFSYRNFSLSFNIYANVGGYIYDGDYALLMQNYRSHGRQSTRDILGRWQNPGDITDVPQIGVNQDANARSSRFLYDGTFARVRYINLGYTLPQSLLGRYKVDKVNIYLQADNPFTFFGRPGLDPEQNLGGNTSNRSAQMKTFALGLNIGF